MDTKLNGFAAAVQRGWVGGLPPELVVINALRNKLPEFLLNNAYDNALVKFIWDRLDFDRIMPLTRAT